MQAEVRILMQLVISWMRRLEGSRSMIVTISEDLNNCDDIGTGRCYTDSGARGEGSAEQMSL